MGGDCIMGVSAGRVLLIPKGDWNAETTYTGLDWVRHNGAAWVCKNTCTNVEPTEANSDNWQMMARDGQSGSVIDVDAAMSDTSENPVQNKVIKKYVDDHSTDVDAAMSDTSENPVQNKVIKKYVDDHSTSVDAAMSDTSENPVQNKVIKKYVDDHSTDVDAAMSDTSENPVQNKVIKKYVDDKQVNIDGITLTLDEAKNVIKLADTLKDKIGSALQPESIVNNQITTVEGFTLDARQANPNLDGTLAKQISDLNGSLNFIFNVPQTFTSFANIPNVPGVHIYCVANDGVSIPDSPYPGQRGWWNVINFGYIGRMTQITSQAYKIADYDYKGKDELWIRSLHDVTWSEWVKL